MSGAAALATRYRPGADADATQPVHLVPLPVRTAVGAVGAFCGTLLSLPKLEAVESGQGVPCSMCVRQHSATTQAPRSETDYSSLDWPVQLHGDQLVLPLGHCATAHIVPMDLVAAITPILAALDRPVPVLIHPDAPGCGLVIAGEPYGVPLPWPATVQVVSGMLPLPPARPHTGRCTGINTNHTIRWPPAAKSTSSQRCAPLGRPRTSRAELTGRGSRED